MTISLCTTCGNRLAQFRQTFAANVAVVSRDENVEWIVLDYNSTDGLADFLARRSEKLPPNFVYVRESSGRPWHMSMAKNIAHRLGFGDFLMNLDADNFVADSLSQIRALAQSSIEVVHFWSGVFRDGTCGRIALRRNAFDALGGYDEAFEPVGFEDRDLLARANALRLSLVYSPCQAACAIPNSKNLTLSNILSGTGWNEMMEANRAASAANILAKRLVANPSGFAFSKVTLRRGGPLAASSEVELP